MKGFMLYVHTFKESAHLEFGEVRIKLAKISRSLLSASPNEMHNLVVERKLIETLMTYEG